MDTKISIWDSTHMCRESLVETFRRFLVIFKNKRAIEEHYISGDISILIFFQTVIKIMKTTHKSYLDQNSNFSIIFRSNTMIPEMMSVFLF